MGKKLYIKTFGCQMNEYDSARIGDLLADAEGMELTRDPDSADVVLFNTCSIREKAEEKLFSELGRWRGRKLSNPELILGVGGCVASLEGEAIRRRAPHVDIVFGPQTLHRLPELFAAVRDSCTPAIDVSFPEIEKFDHLPEPRADGVRAFVSVMEGCSKYCSYCVVPYTRGEEIHRPFDDILAEVDSLAAQGVCEITLLGQNVNAYRGTTHDGRAADLALLIEYVALVEGIERIRFTTSHPAELGDSLIAAYAREPKLANHLHLPVQSGADRILQLMKRGHTIGEYREKIRKLREARPDISLSSDFIVGFPGETEEDFQLTLDLVAELNFDQSFSFIYSKRPGTPAANMEDVIPHAIKNRRLQILQDRLNAQAQALSLGMVGSIQPVLVEGAARRSLGEMSGRTGNNRMVNFPGDPGLIGTFAPVRITAVMTNSLRGELVQCRLSTDRLAVNGAGIA
ncbi:MAG: tRNA (N6-isopentenyl adenosine(37)-C2)-methylthiotransferase MiaB [Gammaproteobacteria bacterium]|nr:MAG: tRNA (N6-isopentenyl adenosine(37)-C2)-methylthiotransferase MiaB [Gammaproteobacteria bacterium]